MLAERGIPTEKRGSRPHVRKAGEVSASDWTSNWRIYKRHVGPVLLKVGNAVYSGDFGPKTWLDFTSVQFPPVDWFEPFVALDFFAPSGSTA